MASFELALAQGADAIELDARLTADEQVVVFHDRMVNRTTNGSGRLAQMTLAEVRALDAGGFFSEKYRGEKVPLLEDVFGALSTKTFINLEFKNHGAFGDLLVRRVCQLVLKCGIQDRIMFSSFAPRNLAKARELLPGVPRGLLAYPHIAGAWARSFGFSFGDYAALHPAVGDVDPAAIQRVHRLRRRIHVWTVNQPVDLLHLKHWGADGIITDDPALALRALGRPT